MSANLNADLDLAVRLADAADAITMPKFSAADLRVETKPDRTPVTEADLAAEQAMLDILAAERPNDAILSEEAGESGVSTRRWIIDPIDGTKQFLRGLPSWATLIALQDGDETVVGLVSAPALGRRWWAVKGEGAFTDDGRRINVSAVADLGDAVLLHAELSAWQDAPCGPEGLEALAGRCWQSRGYGDFWIHCLVAEGAGDVAVEPGPSLWDLAAPALIVEEAGGRFSGLDGAPGPGNGSGLSSNGLLHDHVVELLSGN
jgi:histidinol-phosphatase